MLNNHDIISEINPSWLLILCGFITSFVITYIGIPSVVRLARIKGLYDLPGNRTSHDEPTPRLGGAMIFAGVIISSVLFTGLTTAFELKFIIAGMIILFFIGVKDDIVSLVPIKKAIGQFLAAFVIVVVGDINLSCCNYFFDGEVISWVAGSAISIFLVLVLVNSINFIDGIDGLASGSGILSSSLFGWWFIVNGQLSYAIMCFSLTGSLLAFLYFNVFSKSSKIFLGDTGSMLIGFLLAVFVLRSLEINSNLPAGRILNSGPSIALSVLFVPVFDAMRIVILRMANRKSIFEGDRNHLHHKVLRLAGTHLKATSIILVVNILIVILTYLLRNTGNAILIPLLVILGIGFSLTLGLTLKRQSAK